MAVQAAPILAILLVPYALGFRRGALLGAGTLVLLSGAAAIASPAAGGVTAGLGLASASVWALTRACGGSPHAGMCAVGVAALLLVGSLFLVGPAVEGAVARGAAFESIRPAVQAVLDVHPYCAISAAQGRRVLSAGFLYRAVGAYRVREPALAVSIGAPAAFAAVLAVLAGGIRLLRSRPRLSEGSPKSP